MPHKYECEWMHQQAYSQRFLQYCHGKKGIRLGPHCNHKTWKHSCDSKSVHKHDMIINGGREDITLLCIMYLGEAGSSTANGSNSETTKTSNCNKGKTLFL
eukprot:1157906-Pelagomonas_calceolata.AAC.8